MAVGTATRVKFLAALAGGEYKPGAISRFSVTQMAFILISFGHNDTRDFIACGGSADREAAPKSCRHGFTEAGGRSGVYRY
jgi:hypothetical protein